MVWYRENELFFDAMITVRDMPDGHCYCTVVGKVKPLWLDDFIDNLHRTPYHKELRESLAMVQNEEYREALNYLKELGGGYFKIEILLSMMQ